MTIFSRIIAGEIPSYKVAEDEQYYAFLDINPLTAGHTLVVPKIETDYIFDLDDQTLQGMILFAKRVAEQIKRVAERSGEKGRCGGEPHRDDSGDRGSNIPGNRLGHQLPRSSSGNAPKITCNRVAMVVLGLEVPHAHIHLIPIMSENDVDFRRKKLKFTPEEFEEIAEVLRG